MTLRITLIFTKSIASLFFILTFSNFSGTAQTSNLTFDAVSKKNGLSNNAVKTMFQDHLGFMWFGTINGLNRFDGKEFVIYNHHPKSKQSISNDFINCIAEDSLGMLWVGTSKGINRYNPATGEFQNFKNNPNSLKVFRQEFITSLRVDKQQSIWIGTRNSGLFKFDPKRNSYQSIKIPGANSITINCIQQDKNANIWIGTLSGLYRLSFNSKTILATKISSNLINVIFKDSFDNMWIGSAKGLSLISQSQITAKLPKPIEYNYTSNNITGLSHNDVTSICEDKENTLWVGTDGGGLNKTTIGKTNNNLEFLHYQSIPDNPNSLRQNQIFSIIQDLSGVVWIGTNDGISKIQKIKNQFVHFQSNPLNNNSLRNNNLAAMEKAYIGGIEYIICGSTGGTGMDVIKSSDVHLAKESFVHLPDNNPSLNKKKYQSFLVDGDLMWVGTKSGIRLYNLPKKTFIAIPKSLEDLPENIVRQIHKDVNGLLWIGTNKGLFTWSNISQQLVRIKLSGSIIDDNDYRSFMERSSEDNVFALAEDKNNHIWIGTWGGGLLRFNIQSPTEKPTFYTKQNSKINSNYVVSLLYDKGNLWIGTAEGLNTVSAVDTKKSSGITSINLVKGLKNNHIAGILADKQQNLWMATLNGILKYDVSTKKVFTYDISRGDLSKENYRMGLSQDSAGYLYFGGINGLVAFQPNLITADQNVYPLLLTDFRILRKNQPDSDAYVPRPSNFTESLKLTPKEYAFSFAFSSLNYKISNDITYAYMLDGIDKSFITVKSDQRFATYSNLKPGKYELLVKATNEYGSWSSPKKLLSITVLTPWWLSWWAYICYILLAGAAVYAIVKYVLEKERLQNSLLIERLEKERVKEVDELKFKYFTNISHEFRTPLTLILGPLEQLYQVLPNINAAVKENLNHIQHNVNHLLRLITQLMDFRKVEEGNLKLAVSQNDLPVFLQEVTSNFKILAKKKHVDLILNYVDENVREIWCDWDKLEKILNNLIHNAISFTPENGVVKVNVCIVGSAVDKKLQLEVVDSGKDIPKDELSYIFNHFYQASNQTRSFSQGYGIGLSLTNDLVRIHKGEISVESDGETGASFTILLPVNKLNFTEAELANGTQVSIANKNVFVFADSETEPAKPDISDKINNHQATLLIVDDNKDVRNYLVKCFSENYKIEEAADGAEGLKKAISLAPDLIISDVMMPIMDGNAFCEKLKSDLATSHIPVVLLTALGAKEHVVQGLEKGADLYITKPFHNEVLQLSVKNLLDSRNKLKEQFTNKAIIEPSEVTANSIDQVFLSKAMLTVENNISNTEYSIDDFVEQMELGRSALYRKLKQLTGQSPNEFIRTVRLKRAAQLLKQDAGNVSEIAYQTGFIDPAYFARCFKKQFGITPTEFK